MQASYSQISFVLFTCYPWASLVSFRRLPDSTWCTNTQTRLVRMMTFNSKAVYVPSARLWHFESHCGIRLSLFLRKNGPYPQFFATIVLINIANLYFVVSMHELRYSVCNANNKLKHRSTLGYFRNGTQSVFCYDNE